MAIIRASVGRFILPKKCVFFCSGLFAAIWARGLMVVQNSTFEKLRTYSKICVVYQAFQKQMEPAVIVYLKYLVNFSNF